MIVLKRRSSPLNFYESFSDLIFNTLVIFLFLILGLAVNVNKRVESVAADEARVAAQLRESQQRLEQLLKSERAMIDRRAALDKEAEALAAAVDVQKKRSENLDRMIEQQQSDLKKLVLQQEQVISQAKRKIADLEGSTRFTGSSGNASLTIACVPGSGNQIYFIPGDALDRYSVTVIGETAAEQTQRRQAIVREVVASARQQRGMSVAECQRLLRSISWFRGEGGDKARVHSLMSFLFGSEVSSSLGRTFSQQEAENILVKLRVEPADPAVKQMPTLRVRVPPTSGTITVGDGLQLTPDELICLLKSSSGTKLAMELDLGDGERIPDWFLRDVMHVTGYINRVPDLPPADR